MLTIKLQPPKSIPSHHRLRFSLWRILIALAASLLVTVGTAHAQAVKGTLLGTVTDSSGAAAAGATVRITGTGTNITTITTTNQDGNYVFSSIQDGVYRVQVT